ncbi:putative U3 small nucleolar RNA-associated protein 11 [Tupaia chinensis]|uniref:Probable U3 small nucleolar RNA-associated protein 11 n=1 Tax=Tupaia chinensis TaxID=246437 RepID=L9JD18_TUPCH|nr:putative U3 small nucleolar RNA-associated protein 11 [Tupaia chinensis]
MAAAFRKAAKSRQREHPERSQPGFRKHLGLLEKKKDYKLRADDYHKKQEFLRVLRKKALEKNPDEFYYKMTRVKLQDGVHVIKETKEEVTPEQLKLMRTQDVKYIEMKRVAEAKRLAKERQKQYNCLAQRIEREKKLFVIAQKIQTRKDLLDKTQKVKAPDARVKGWSLGWDPLLQLQSGLVQTPCRPPAQDLDSSSSRRRTRTAVYYALLLPDCSGRQRPSLAEELGSVLAASSASVNCVPARFDTI